MQPTVDPSPLIFQRLRWPLLACILCKISCSSLYCVHTYILIHFDEFGRDCSWDLCHAHTPCPPAALQSRSELLFGGVYPVAGGLSGNCFRNPPWAILKASRVVWLFTSLGRMFQRRVALTPNELSYAVDMDFCAL